MEGTYIVGNKEMYFFISQPLTFKWDENGENETIEPLNKFICYYSRKRVDISYRGRGVKLIRTKGGNVKIFNSLEEIKKAIDKFSAEAFKLMKKKK
jgi:hypothetical protein